MRYVITSETKIDKIFDFDVIIVGAGLAGLYTALNLDENLSCVILAKDNINISSSWLAQGGIAAAISDDDTPELHFEDTVVAGAGLCNTEAAKILVGEGPQDIKALVKLNVPFDLDENGELQFTREGGHNKRRVVHAGGDATGRETVKALSHIVSKRKNITFSGHSCLFDIVTDENGITGAIVKYNDSEFLFFRARHVVIATGGIGQVYKSSTNPSIATGDGIAAAMRAGAQLKNIEFVQFHPSGLWLEDSDGHEFLISEAVRGEGGLLVNAKGQRFMVGQHELAELAPRDIVARGILKELKKSGETHAFIDITAKSDEFLKMRFPTIYSVCLDHGINISTDWIPVCPVQHYLMGGIDTDIDGRTNIPGLFAVGEAANTGVHGANRLASNSMLECLVFGRRTATSINDYRIKSASHGTVDLTKIPLRPHGQHDYAILRNRVRTLMSDHCGALRHKDGLTYALSKISEILKDLESIYDDSITYLEALNIATVAKAIVDAALNRPDSIGSHCVEDHYDK
ncbi:MAG: L-aspartate oxidase [Oscillospiraceae bacterium]|nr:L-aspartate oxidase [Oscillospiraceae bacterium]